MLQHTFWPSFDCHLVYFSVAMNTYKGVYSLFLAEGERKAFYRCTCTGNFGSQIMFGIDNKCFTCQMFSNSLPF